MVVRCPRTVRAVSIRTIPELLDGIKPVPTTIVVVYELEHEQAVISGGDVGRVQGSATRFQDVVYPVPVYNATRVCPVARPNLGQHIGKGPGTDRTRCVSHAQANEILACWEGGRNAASLYNATGPVGQQGRDTTGCLQGAQD